MIIVHATTMVKVQARTTTELHACTNIITHSCITIDHCISIYRSGYIHILWLHYKLYVHSPCMWYDHSACTIILLLAWTTILFSGELSSGFQGRGAVGEADGCGKFPPDQLHLISISTTPISSTCLEQSICGLVYSVVKVSSINFLSRNTDPCVQTCINTTIFCQARNEVRSIRHIQCRKCSATCEL